MPTTPRWTMRPAAVGCLLELALGLPNGMLKVRPIGKPAHVVGFLRILLLFRIGLGSLLLVLGVAVAGAGGVLEDVLLGREMLVDFLKERDLFGLLRESEDPPEDMACDGASVAGGDDAIG